LLKHTKHPHSDAQWLTTKVRNVPFNSLSFTSKPVQYSSDFLSQSWKLCYLLDLSFCSRRSRSHDGGPFFNNGKKGHLKQRPSSVQSWLLLSLFRHLSINDIDANPLMVARITAIFQAEYMSDFKKNGHSTGAVHLTKPAPSPTSFTLMYMLLCCCLNGSIICNGMCVCARVFLQF
jgi:hypothetical protein